MITRSIRFGIIALLLAVAFPAAAQFNDIERAVDREIGGRKVWIPFKGLARLYVKATHPEGVKDFQLAVYEDAGTASRGRIDEIFRRKLGPEWRPLVRATSRHDGDEVVIYAREADGGESIDMIIFASDPDETVLMMSTLDIEKFVVGLADPGGFASH